ncbi:MAG: tetratricopeptide repeat protein [Cytophagaceae bacterium]|nr:tetratricopeptide repeat protein [Cytophagaceae bacterium]
MKKLLQSIGLICFLLISLPCVGQTVDNKVPMYGEVPKSKKYQEMDEDFIKDLVKQFGSKEKAYEAHIKFALSYFYHDSLALSMKRFNQAWLLDPDAPECYFGFGALTEMKGNYTEANRLYALGFKKRAKKERVEEALLKIADCQEHRNDFQGTVNTYHRITEINPANIFAYKKLGYLYSGFDMKEESLFNYSKAIALDPVDKGTYNNRGYLYHKNKDYEKAIVDYSKAIELDPKYISAYVNRGLSKNELEDFVGAKEDFQMSADLDPKSPELKRYLGYAKYNVKDIEGACTEFSILLKMGYVEAQEWMKEINCK